VVEVNSLKSSVSSLMKCRVLTRGGSSLTGSWVWVTSWKEESVAVYRWTYPNFIGMILIDVKGRTGGVHVADF
jgi:hypothetical protein